MLAELLSQCGHDTPPVAKHRGAQRPASQYYKFARGGLCFTCDDFQFSDRFRFLFAECASSRAELDGLQIFFLELTTNHISNTSLITFDAKEGLDYCTFIRELFPERNLRVSPDNTLAKWRCLTEFDGTEPVIAVGVGLLLVDRNYAWQAIVAQFAVSNVMRMQQDVWFFHAATVGIGESGVLIFGAKGAGKTTLSLALAARSHAFLGDEYAAVWVRAGALLPFRRAVSIRHGVRAARLEARLQGMNPLIDRTQDGSNRVRLSVRDVFPDAPSRSLNLSHCLFLRSFKREPAVVEFASGESCLPLLQPLLSSLWCLRSGTLTFDFLRTFSKARCLYVDVGGTADETAELIERVVEGK